MKEKVFFKDVLFNELEAELNRNVSDLGNLEEAITNYFPSIAWSADLVWAILKDSGLRTFLADRVEKIAAERMYLDCGFNLKNVERSMEQRLNLQIIRSNVKASTRLIYSFDAGARKSLTTCLRLGVVRINKGVTTWADAAEAKNLFQEYCSVTVESSAEKEFFEKVCKMRAALGDIIKAQQTIDETRNELAARFAPDESRDFINLEYTFNPYDVFFSGSIRLWAESTPWRALIM
jgi:hypothetical protein